MIETTLAITHPSLASRQNELESLVSAALSQAGDLGASLAQAQASLSRGFNVTVRLGEVETVEYQRDRGLSITVYFGQRTGSASTSDFSPQAIKSTVEAACRIARFTQEDSAAGLADAQLMARHFPDLSLHHPWVLDVEQAIEMARACEAVARAHDPRISNSEGASVDTGEGLSVYGNSHGFLASRLGTRHGVSCTVIASKNGAMQRDYWYTAARDAADLESVEVVGRRAAERAVARLGAQRLTTRRTPVLFVPELAKGLIGHMVSAVSGGSLYRKASFLIDAVDQPIFPRGVRIHEQPGLPKAMGSASFDAEGVATKARDLVTDGVLKGYVLDSYSGRKLGLPTTGNAGGVHNLTVEPTGPDLSGLMRQMGSGLMVTELLGSGTNMVTGDYSRGAAGFWVEGGELAYPVEEITVAGNLRDMFKGLVAIGNDVDCRGNVRCGSLLLDTLTVAGE